MKDLLATLVVLIGLVMAFPLAAKVQTRVIDGDTIEWTGQRIHLFGIDAPEQDQECRDGVSVWLCGKEASKHLRDFIQERAVTCKKRDTDRNGDMVAVCFTDNVDINDYMVTSGFAMADRKTSYDYVRSEKAARNAKRGIWRGKFQPPWEWRNAKRAKADKNNMACKLKGKIKGDINRRGERIYHVPGSQNYSRIKIMIFKGERWFCSEATARAEGWRKSKP